MLKEKGLVFLKLRPRREDKHSFLCGCSASALSFSCVGSERRAQGP